MRILKKIFLLLLIAVLIYGISYAWRAAPILSGYGAKTLCSCVMLAGRETDDVLKNELGQFPLSIGSFETTFSDSSATGSVFGLAFKKAIYRKGLGCTLINGITEEELRNQKYSTTTPPLHQDTIQWPLGDVLADTTIPGVNYEQLNQVVASAFEEPGPDKLRRTRSIVIVYDGQIILEKYAEGFNKNSKLTGWSMSKSITNALIGILVKKRTLDINKPAPVDSWKDDERKNITLNNLLHASSGLKWVEQYGGPSDATNMLFKEKDMGLFAAEHQIEFNPGEKFVYSSGTSNLLSWIIRKSVGEDDYYYRFPYEQLFYKIGMRQTTMEPDAGGTFVGSSYTFGTARDWARFGLLYLNDGWFNGKQILPKGWVEYTTTPAPAAPLGEYGAQFWLNAGARNNPSHRIFPDVPTDLYWADGFEGQNVFILPSKKLVVVKLSLSQGDYLDDNKFLAGIIDALP